MLRTCPTDSQVSQLKKELVNELRKDGRCVLTEGSLEDYFPDDLSSADKVEGALALCRALTSAEEIGVRTQFMPDLRELMAREPVHSPSVIWPPWSCG